MMRNPKSHLSPFYVLRLDEHCGQCCPFRARGLGPSAGAHNTQLCVCVSAQTTQPEGPSGLPKCRGASLATRIFPDCANALVLRSPRATHRRRDSRSPPGRSPLLRHARRPAEPMLIAAVVCLEWHGCHQLSDLEHRCLHLLESSQRTDVALVAHAAPAAQSRPRKLRSGHAAS